MCFGHRALYGVMTTLTQQRESCGRVKKMNTANLQLEGFYLVVAAIGRVLLNKGVLSPDEIAAALTEAEEAATRDTRLTHLSAAELDAVAFPARFLAVALEAPSTTSSFSEIAKQVGQRK